MSSAAAAIRLNPPFRAEHIGSLLRPSVLFEKRSLYEQKQISKEDLRAAEDEAIKYVVQLQRDVGMNTITDGELRRGMFFEGVFDNLEGITPMPTRPIETFKRYIPHIGMMYAYGVQEADTVFCTGKIKRTKPFYLDQFNFVKGLVPAKVPLFIARYEYFDDLGIAYRAEIQELYDNGCRNIQIDDPTFCYFCNDNMILQMEEVGVDHEALLDTYIRAINGGVHFSEGGYARIATKLFNNLDVDTFYLEYDTERAGDFAPLKHLPNNKVAVLGLVTTKNPKLETVEEIKCRVNEAVDAMTKDNPERTREDALNQLVLLLILQVYIFDFEPPNRLCISTQCGFASVWEGNPVTEEDERNKLAVLVEAAKQLWPYVFSGYNGATQPVTITGTIPGGQSFLLFPPLGSTSYTWNADVAAGTSLLFTMVDAQGRNGGTSDIKTVGITDDYTCLNAQSPSSTAVSLSPTSTSLATGSSQTASPSPSAVAQQKTSIAAIAGTVIGALIFLAVVITLGLFFLRKRRDNGNSRHPINRDIDLTYDPGHTYDNYPYYSTATSGSASAAPLTSVQGISGYDSSSFTDGAQTQQYYQQASYTPSTPYTTSEYQSQSQHRYQDNSEYQSQTPYPEASQYLPSLHSLPQSHSQQGSEADPFNPYELTSDPSLIRPYDVSEAGSTTMSSAQRKAAMAGVQPYTPSRFIVHTDVEDELPPPNHDGIVELPPQYSERRAPPSLINATPGSSSQTYPQRVS
ncbi:hypothetical protein H0H93_015195 [Arthromyces matolae]|nr:hypothetical protein H0H93_015195 [Arthromyces matolae]